MARYVILANGVYIRLHQKMNDAVIYDSIEGNYYSIRKDQQIMYDDTKINSSIAQSANEIWDRDHKEY